LAEQAVQNALDAEFEPLETQLKQLNQLYLFNKDALERADKKRADALNIAIGERDRVLKLQRADKQAIFDVALTAGQFGADAKTLQRIQNARTREEAVTLASGFLQDPAAVQALRNAELDNKLTKLRITREAEELAMFRKYGGLTPAQWAETRKKEEEERQKEQDEIDLAEEKSIELQQDIKQINAILNSKALDTVVGASPLTRGISRTEGFFPSTLGFFGGGGLFGGFSAIDELGGGADDVVALTEQLISQEFLNKLVAEKGKGATFGQLSDREGAALRAAASAIGQTAIRNNDDKVVGYDMSERAFKEQLNILLDGVQRAHIKVTGEQFTEEENELFDELETIDAAFTNPAGFF
jgi:hypothetical protein